MRPSLLRLLAAASLAAALPSAAQTPQPRPPAQTPQQQAAAQKALTYDFNVSARIVPTERALTLKS